MINLAVSPLCLPTNCRAIFQVRYNSSNLNIYCSYSRERLRPQFEGFEVVLPHYSVFPGTCENAIFTVCLFSCLAGRIYLDCWCMNMANCYRRRCLNHYIFHLPQDLKIQLIVLTIISECGGQKKWSDHYVVGSLALRDGAFYRSGS